MKPPCVFILVCAASCIVVTVIVSNYVPKLVKARVYL